MAEPRAAIVTGGGRGLGTAVAARLATDGLAVAVVDIDLDAAGDTARGIVAAGGSAVAIECDLRDEARMTAAFDAAEERFGPVRVFVNNAAVFPAGPFVDVTAAVLDDTIAVNQRAYFLAAQWAARSMIASAGGGSIVNVGSIVWHGHWDGMAPYIATKGAIVALTRTLARELGGHRIRVNAVAPGAFPTRAEAQQHPDLAAYEQRILESQALKRRGAPAELAAVVSFLCSDDASFVTGQTINVDGGWVMT